MKSEMDSKPKGTDDHGSLIVEIVLNGTSEMDSKPKGTDDSLIDLVCLSVYLCPKWTQSRKALMTRLGLADLANLPDVRNGLKAERH